MSPSARAAWALGWAALLAWGCGDDRRDPSRSHDIPCDIAEPACERAVFAWTARVREQDDARLPQSRIITRDQYADETRRELAAQVPKPVDLQYDRALQLLHFIPQGESTAGSDAESDILSVLAYYASDSKQITIVADAAANEPSGTLTLSHEFVHALQDQREGLRTIYEGAASTDAQLATAAFVEGEAMLLSTVVLDETLGTGFDHPAFKRYLQSYLAGLFDVAVEKGAPFTWAQQLLPYPVGSLVLADAYASADGAAGVQRFFASRPKTLAGYLQPRTDVPGPLRCNYPDAPAGYARFGFDRFGAAGLFALEVVAGSTGEQAYQRASKWSNDSIAFFAPSDQSVQAAVAWRIALTDIPAATELETRLRAANKDLELTRQDNELVITVASQPGVLSAWTTRLACSTQKSLDEPQALRPVPTRWHARRNQK